ncbi:MAG: TatD family hydrolase [Planctomycetaceae bacterium]|nr:TatD family hydrolase [Planctomycetales bacterium]MCB9874766.1 TatD family hydrolase [Planctomycetaceae bacterium]MCB9939034.1 TatD family hydrolase [Planctomycetaceae bacterium]HRX80377.1 TatD family hydrolase [Pirellulaceae bacterium]
MRFFDTHCHLDDDDFDSDRDRVISRATQAGVETILAVGTTADSSSAVVALAARYPSVLAAVGIQPNYCAEAKSDDWTRVVELACAPRVVAIGETGLDRYWDHTPFDVQQDYFDRHIRLSQAKSLPFIVHLRDCEEDILEMLRDARARGPLQGVMHSYTGTAAGAAECIELGLYISFAGMVTYKKSDDLRAVAVTIPDDRILIETDAPYLSPHPKRGQRPNEPALVVHTAVCLAEVRGVSLKSLAELTTANACRLFTLRR